MYVLTKQVDMFINCNATAVFASGIEFLNLLHSGETLVPRSLPGFQSLQDEKAREASCLSACEHDMI